MVTTRDRPCWPGSDPDGAVPDPIGLAGEISVAMPQSVEVSVGGLVVDEVTVAFGGLTALDQVSLTVEPREVVGVIGPNGAGKTTLFNVVCGFVRPSRGRLEFNGRTLRRHRPHDLAGLGIARTLQGVGLWPGLTVVENVIAGATARAKAGLASSLFGLPRSSGDEASLAQRAVAVLEELRIADYTTRLPGALPYAIQKRVALARALVNEPSLILLDEPASGLSEAEMDELGALVGRLRERMSVLLVEHHMDLVMSICDRLVVLDFGQVIATGSPAEVKVNPAVTRAYLGEDVSAIQSADMTVADEAAAVTDAVARGAEDA
jgi:branched-chain amino acid transport system ATP-binding protein